MKFKKIEWIGKTSVSADVSVSVANTYETGLQVLFIKLYNTQKHLRDMSWNEF